MSDDDGPFLETFFGLGNAIQWSAYVDSPVESVLRTELGPWIDRWRRRASPFLLPRVNVITKATTWYALCTEPREARAVWEELTAYVGPTYGTLRRMAEVADPVDPIDEACRRRFGPFFFCLRVTRQQDRPRVSELLRLMVSTRDRRARRAPQANKPIGRLLRDLEMAFLVRDQAEAERLFSEIKGRGRLNAANLSFLRVRVLAEFGKWQAILALPQFPDLLAIPRPIRVAEDLATAIYRDRWASLEAARDATGAIREFHASGHRYRALLRSTEAFRSADALKLALVAAVTTDASGELARRLLPRLEESDRAYGLAILAHRGRGSISIPDMSVAADLATAPDAKADARYDVGDYDGAFPLYCELPPTSRYLARVVEIAEEIDTLAAAATALDYFDKASDATRQVFLSRNLSKRAIERLRARCGVSHVFSAPAIESWEAWFRLVDDPSDSRDPRGFLERGRREWQAKPNAVDVEFLAGALRTTRIGRAREVIRNASPFLIRAFLPESGPVAAFKPIYKALIDHLVYDETIGTDDLEAIALLIDAILRTNPSRHVGNNDFVEAVDIIRSLWCERKSPTHLDWVLDSLDSLIDVAAQNHALLAPLLAEIVEAVQGFRRRVQPSQWRLMQLLSTDLGLPETFIGEVPQEHHDQVEDNPFPSPDALVGKSIAVYTLTERISKRFERLVRDAFSGVTVRLLHDKVLTDRMKSLAKSADLFIVNIWDAKHAATNGIANHRPASLPTMNPKGKSATAMFECVAQYARQLGG